jgi:hypothetical protein
MYKHLSKNSGLYLGKHLPRYCGLVQMCFHKDSGLVQIYKHMPKKNQLDLGKQLPRNSGLVQLHKHLSKNNFRSR